MEQGFAATTVPQITARAGLTTRTFFRHYADKREVVFGGMDFLQDLLVSKVVTAPAADAPIKAVTSAFAGVGFIFEQNAEVFRQRQRIIDATPELQARELSKLAAAASAIAKALRGRGVAEPAATLAAELGVLIFRLTFERWVHQPAQPDWTTLFRELLREAGAVAASAASGITSS